MYLLIWRWSFLLIEFSPRHPPTITTSFTATVCVFGDSVVNFCWQHTGNWTCLTACLRDFFMFSFGFPSMGWFFLVASEKKEKRRGICVCWYWLTDWKWMAKWAQPRCPFSFLQTCSLSGRAVMLLFSPSPFSLHTLPYHISDWWWQLLLFLPLDSGETVCHRLTICPPIWMWQLYVQADATVPSLNLPRQVTLFFSFANSVHFPLCAPRDVQCRCGCRSVSMCVCVWVRWASVRCSLCSPRFESVDCSSSCTVHWIVQCSSVHFCTLLHPKKVAAVKECVTVSPKWRFCFYRWLFGTLLAAHTCH